jgi:hypothetical protein
MKIKETLLNELKVLDITNKKVSVEHLQLFIDSEKQHRIASGEDPFECYVVGIEHLQTFLTSLSNANFIQAKRLQLIINSKGHYSTIDILWGLQLKKCLLLDAANDPRMFGVYLILNEFPFDRIFVVSGRCVSNGRSNNLQRDFNSCPIFSFDHAVQVSKIEIYSQLQRLVGENANKMMTLLWEQLPMQLVWNAQSFKFLDAYLAENRTRFSRDDLIAYEQYLKTNTGPDASGKDRNIAVDNIFVALLTRNISRLETLDENQVNSIIAEVSQYPRSVRENVVSFFFRAQPSVTVEDKDSLIPDVFYKF